MPESERIAQLQAEINRLTNEGSPGVMHAVDKAFYDLTVCERDHERRRVDRLTAELEERDRKIEVLTREVERLRELWAKTVVEVDAAEAQARVAGRNVWCLCERRCGDVFEAEDDPRRSVCKGLPRKP